MLDEHDSVPWDALSGDDGSACGGGEYRLRDRPERLAHSYTLQAVKRRLTAVRPFAPMWSPKCTPPMSLPDDLCSGW